MAAINMAAVCYNHPHSHFSHFFELTGHDSNKYLKRGSQPGSAAALR